MTTSCYLNVGPAVIKGLGKAVERYVLLVEHTDTNCADWRFHVVVTVAGKGSVGADARRPGFSPFSQDGTSRYRITGGSGAFRGASGAGKIASTGTETGPGHGIGTDTWTGTLVKPRLRSMAGRTGSLDLTASFPLTPDAMATECPTGTATTTECFAFSSTARVAGLGVVTEKYLAFDDQADVSCRHTSWSPAVLTIAGKGEIDASLAPVRGCDAAGLFIGAGNFTITGGSGLYAGASGSGTESAGSFVFDSWRGTITVPGLDFDTAPPVFHGVKARTVRVRAGVKRVRVEFMVTAGDSVDGPVPVVCRPRSGSLFRVGRTAVSCSATDSSANTRTAEFTVTVRRR